MKLLVAIFFVPILAAAQPEPSRESRDLKAQKYLDAYFTANGSNSDDYNRFFFFVHQLSDKKLSSRSQGQFLSKVFLKIHRRFLKSYRQDASFTQLLTNGTYNCLTATALYGLVLDYLGFEYQTIETNYHIFILVESENGKVLFESTDAYHGFITDSGEIESRINAYKQNSFASSGGKKYFRYRNALFNPVNLDQMTGLIHYNLAVEAYNREDYVTTVSHFEKACKHYNSDRTEEFSKLILYTIQEKADPQVKQALIDRIRAMGNHKSNVVASIKNR